MLSIVVFKNMKITSKHQKYASVVSSGLNEVVVLVILEVAKYSTVRYIVRQVISTQLQYRTVNAVWRFLVKRPALMTLRLKVAAMATKPHMLKICRINETLIKTSPALREALDACELATLAAPLPVKASTIPPKAKNVVTTRPGCIGL